MAELIPLYIKNIKKDDPRKINVAIENLSVDYFPFFWMCRIVYYAKNTSTRNLVSISMRETILNIISSAALRSFPMGTPIL
jgi:hypothetical protein